MEQVFKKDGQPLNLMTESDIEYGSNNNGEYWKFSNGLLICRKTLQEERVPVRSDTYINGGYLLGSVTFDYPINFIDVPSVTVSAVMTGDALIVWNDVTSKYAKVIIYCNYPTNPNSVRVQFAAIGRWK